MSSRPILFVRTAVRDRLLALPPRPWEVGGWLLGYWVRDGSAVVITAATPPAFRGSALGIKIDGRGGHSRRFNEAWDASGGRVTFLGDWHTHPRSAPVPSRQDERAVRQLAEDPKYGTPTPLMIIVRLGLLPGSKLVPQAAFYWRTPAGLVQPLAPLWFDVLSEESAKVPEWDWPSDRSPATSD